MNTVILIGRLTKDPELTYAPGTGNAVCRFTMAVPRAFKKEETDFINCVAFNKAGETIAQYLTKGSPLSIRGSIRTGSYENKEGLKIYTTQVTVDEFEFISNSKTSKNLDDSSSEDTNNSDGVIDPFNGFSDLSNLQN